jgi:hypothetical protein
MTKMPKIFLALSAACFSLFANANGQIAGQRIEREIIEFRAQIRQAVKAKDRKNLERFFAENFTHTHASGKVDGKAERIDFFIKGEPTIEDVEPDEIRVVVHDKNLATAVGKTTLAFGAEKRAFQWTGVFRKRRGKWQVVATHATALRN